MEDNKKRKKKRRRNYGEAAAAPTYAAFVHSLNALLTKVAKFSGPSS
jgi:hypothetical protein